MLNIINLLKTHKNKKKNQFIVSERQYIGITATINDFRSTLASCEELSRIWGYVCGVNGVSVLPYPHPQLFKVFKDLIYVWHGCGMQFERFYSLSDSVLG